MKATTRIAFIQEPQTIERILHHIGEPTEAPQVLPARAPPQHALEFDQSVDVDEWPDVDKTAGDTDDFVATYVVHGEVCSRLQCMERFWEENAEMDNTQTWWDNAPERGGLRRRLVTATTAARKGGCFSYPSLTASGPTLGVRSKLQRSPRTG